MKISKKKADFKNKKTIKRKFLEKNPLFFGKIEVKARKKDKKSLAE